MIYKTYKYRIYPNEKQKDLIEKTFSACRLVYNLAKEIKDYVYKSQKINLSAFELNKQLKDLKKDFIWLSDVDSQALGQSVINLEKAYKNFFTGSGFPKFKTKKSTQSFQCPNNARKVDFIRNTITIPKIKNIKSKISKKFDGEIKTITISKNSTGKYFASVLVEVDLKLPNKHVIQENTSIGIDVGIKTLATCSNGLFIYNNRYLKRSINRLKVLQRRASKKQKGSYNKQKANLKVALLHEKITNRRKDHLHKSVNKILSDNQTKTIFIEDLNLIGILKNHNIAQSISDASLGIFFRILKYKCNWHGINLIEIGRFEPSSKRCFNCGTLNKELKLKDRIWTCNNCMATLDRDINAANNIKLFGLNKIQGEARP